MKSASKRALCALLAALTGLLGACSGQSVNAGTVPNAATLPPFAEPYAAPADDSDLTASALVNLYLPSRDGQKLLARQQTLELSRGGGNERAILQALLNRGGDAQTRGVGGQLTLQMSGTMPVEVSGDVCTVNLTNSALALEYDEMYTASLAMAATLADLTDIRYVNVMVADVAVSYDVGGNLPAGSVSPHPGEELPVLWDAMEARRTPLGSDVARQPLSATATLYFPLADGSGFVAEARNLTFSGQTPAILASGLLSALSSGPQVVSGCAAMPDIPSLLTLQPTVSEPAEGGRLITLYFREDLQETLAEDGIDFASFVASINWTLSTFIPSITGVRFITGTTMLTALYGEPYGMISVTDGITRRRFFRAGLREQDDILVRAEDRLTYVRRSVPADGAGDPRAMLALMMNGVTPGEAEAGLRSALPDALTGEDVLGIGLADGCLLLNLSEAFASAVAAMGEQDQRLCCYAMVNTLCDALRLTRVRFFWNGQARESLGTPFCWAGEFLCNHALMDP